MHVYFQSFKREVSRLNHVCAPALRALPTSSICLLDLCLLEWRNHHLAYIRGESARLSISKLGVQT